MSLVQVESLHRSFSIVIRHPLFDVLVDVVFYIIADVDPYVTLCVGADFDPYVVVYVGADVGPYVVLYVVPAHLLDGRASIQIIKASGSSGHVGFLPR